MSTPLLLKRIANRVCHPLGINPFPRAFSIPIVYQDKDLSLMFDEIYRRNYWASMESRSGVGSEIAFANNYLKGLKLLLERRCINQLFDAPCGDLNWMAHFLARSSVQYVGGDISQAVVETAKLNNPNLDIRLFEISKDPFPDADLWHCRDCLFHLPFRIIKKALENFCKSSIPYALITTHRSWLLHKNLDVKPGGFRLLDLERSPISLPQPLERIPDYTAGRNFPRYVCLWSREQIADAVKRWQQTSS